MIYNKAGVYKIECARDTYKFYIGMMNKNI